MEHPPIQSSDWDLLIGLAQRLVLHTPRAALVVKTSPESEHYRIERVEIEPDRVTLWTTSTNRHPSRPLQFTTYGDLLEAVIAGAAR